jgi:hypothetical protein
MMRLGQASGKVGSRRNERLREVARGFLASDTGILLAIFLLAATRISGLFLIQWKARKRPPLARRPEQRADMDRPRMCPGARARQGRVPTRR